MKFNQIEIFCKIVELGSFSRAAEASHLSQPTLTEHIKTLEEYLGTALLDRLGREVVPTSAGHILYDYARKILRLKKEAEQTLRSLNTALKGELAIGASTIPGEYVLPSFIKGFWDSFPDIIIKFRRSRSRSGGLKRYYETGKHHRGDPGNKKRNRLFDSVPPGGPGEFKQRNPENDLYQEDKNFS